MAKHFLVQVERTPLFRNHALIPSVETAAFLESVEQQNWLHPNDCHQCTRTSLAMLKANMFSKPFLQRIVPIGSIEFVSEVMRQAYGIREILPQNIPMLLRTEEFLARRICLAPGSTSVMEVMSNWKQDCLFFKSAEHIKCDFAGVYRKGDRLPPTDELLLVSEPIDIASEWRTFVFNGIIRDIRNYAGDPWVVPEKKIVEKMVTAMGKSLPSYTLDVAVTQDSKTVLVEVHNFISCGLYGAAIPLAMYVAAYWHEVGLERRVTD